MTVIQTFSVITDSTNGVITSVKTLPTNTQSVMITSKGGTTLVSNTDDANTTHTFIVYEDETVHLSPSGLEVNGKITITPASSARVVYWAN